MKRQEVLRVLARFDHEVRFSDLSRVLISNSHKRRARSEEAREELHSILRKMEAAGLVSLRTTNRGRGGRGLHVAKRTDGAGDQRVLR